MGDRLPSVPHMNPGYTILEQPPPNLEEMLSFSKEEGAAADALVGEKVLFCWPVVGWCVGTITKRNLNPKVIKRVDDKMEKVNFYIHYEIDDDTVKTILRMSEYGGAEEGHVVGAAPRGGGGRGGRGGAERRIGRVARPGPREGG